METIGATKYGMAGMTVPTVAVAEGASNGAVAPAPGSFIGSPLFWLLGIAGATMGLVGVSTSARVGPFRAAVSAGKS